MDYEEEFMFCNKLIVEGRKMSDGDDGTIGLVGVVLYKLASQNERILRELLRVKTNQHYITGDI